MADPNDGWETVSDPNEVPASLRKAIGVEGVRKAFGIGENDKSLPDSAAKRVEDQVSTFAALKAAAGGFRDDYAGNAWTGELENSLQAKTGFGTPGQRDWWARFRQVDNQIRNDLFGAALTPSEQAAYESTTIKPSMAPAEIRRNLESRQEIVRSALGRRTAYLKANGYRPDAIDALLGEYGEDLNRRDVNVSSAIDEATAKGGDRASGVPGATDGSGTPPTRPEGDLTFNDELPEQRADAKQLTADQKAAAVAVARTGNKQALVELFRGWGLAFSAENEAKLDDLMAFIEKNPDAPINVGEVDNSVKPVDAGDGAAGARARGLANGLLLGFDDEIGAAGETIFSGGTYAQNVNRRRGEALYDEQNNGGSRFFGQVVGSLPLGGVEFGGARLAAREAGIAALRAGLGREVAMIRANRAFAARSALEGAGIGGVYGAGEADGDLADRGVGAAGGAVFGGAVAGAGSLAGGAIVNRRAMAARGAVAPALTDGQQTLAAAERQGITPFAADVGPAAVRNATAGAAQTIGGVGPARRAAQATLDTAEAVRNRVAASLGAPTNPMAAGEAARAGAEQFIRTTGQRIGRIYEVADRAAGTARVNTPEALRVLNQELVPLEESPAASPGLGVLQGLRDSLQQGVTVRGLRNARTSIREQFEATGLRGSNIERVAGRVIDAATDDIVNGLRAQGLDRAANAYRRADRLWAERLRVIDDELEPILGGNTPKSGEQVMQALKGAMQGNNRRFAGFLNALPANEQGIVRASLVQRLGQATKGNQDETGEVFSLNTFLTHWNEIGDTAKARLFGTEGRAALNDLARVAAGSRQAQRFANTSNTGAAVTTGALGTGAVVGGPAAWLPIAGTIMAQYGAGRLLASPRFARWLARPPRQPNPAAARVWVERLTRVARSEPAIAQDVIGLQTRLRDALGGGAARATAEPDAKTDVVDRQRGQQQTPSEGARP